jgi:hypothetical protein
MKEQHFFFYPVLGLLSSFINFLHLLFKKNLNEGYLAGNNLLSQNLPGPKKPHSMAKTTNATLKEIAIILDKKKKYKREGVKDPNY